MNCQYSLWKKTIYDDAGFSFIELAVTLIIIGMLSGAGFLLLGKSVESMQRKETAQRLSEAKNALLIFAGNQGKLMLEGSPPTAYYQKIGSIPVDVWQNNVRYIVSANTYLSAVTLAQYDVCKRAKNPDVAYSGWTPANYWIALDEQIKGANYTVNGTGGKAVVALLLSGGARDADGLGSFFDGGNAGTTFVRKYPSETFDDIIVAITADELYGAIRDKWCMGDVTVLDNRGVGGGIYYVYDVSTGRDVGSANGGDSVIARVPFDDVLVIRDAANGGGTILKAATTITNLTTTITFP